MRSPYKPFLLKLSGLTLIVGALLFLWNFYTPETHTINNAYIIPLYFFVLTTLLHIRLIKAAGKEPKNFVYAFMGSTALRMFITLIALIVYIFIDRPGAMNFAVAFLFCYFIYLIFEVVELQRSFKN